MTNLLSSKNSRTLSIGVQRSPIELYVLISNPMNLPKWAAGLCSGVRKTAGGWIAETPKGEMAFKFAGRNDYGIVDHFVTTLSGEVIYVPMRVVRNGKGSEVLLTIFQGPETSDEEFASDCALVQNDLSALKALAESRTEG